MARALVLIGAPGAGKTSVLGALSSLLEADRVEHGTYESEQLSQGWPLLPASTWIGQLATVLELQRRAGRDLMLIAATVESEAELVDVIDASGAGRTLVASLVASPDTLARRIQSREPEAWLGRQRLIAHARRLAEIVPALPGVDVRISTEDGDTTTVAGQLLDALRERGML